MEIGQRLKAARLEMGLSQRQLCGDLITRNMLSQIENGSARPSMEVLCSLAARLQKPVSYFLEETVVASANQEPMEKARSAYEQGDFEGALNGLKEYQRPDDLFDREWALLGALSTLALARQALAEEKGPYAQALLEQCATFGEKTPYYVEALERQRLLLLSRVQRGVELPDMDEELVLRAEIALDGGDPGRASELLEAAQDKENPRWNLLRGRAAFGLKQFERAAGYFHRAETAYPEETACKLEICYRELEDYKKAYFYATKKSGT